MKKIITAILAITISGSVFAQKNESYTASNGKTYAIGDTIKLGYGSSPNGDFRFLQMGGIGLIAFTDMNGGSDQHNIGKLYANTNVILKKIKSYKVKGATQVVFTVGGGNISNYNLYIEEAIDNCEVVPCKSESTATSDSKIDRLTKLRELFDSGAISESEYEKLKKEILDGQ